MAMFHLLKIRTSIDIFKNEKYKVTFGLEYMSAFKPAYIYFRISAVHIIFCFGCVLIG